MSKTNKIFSDFSKIATYAFGTISDIKKEIVAIVKIRIEKVINRASEKLILKIINVKNKDKYINLFNCDKFIITDFLLDNFTWCRYINFIK